LAFTLFGIYDMCLLAIHFQACADAPLLVAANREEFYARPSLPPSVQAGPPRVLCGVDARAGGTWLGVNQHGVVVAVTNRPDSAPRLLQSSRGASSGCAAAELPRPMRSRGLLCRDLLTFDRAATAIQFAHEQLAEGLYDGANFLCADPEYAAVVHAAARLQVVELPPGLHLLTSGDINDPLDRRQTLARDLFAQRTWHSPAEYLQAAQQVCSHAPHSGPGIVLRGPDRGTVSSTIIALAEEVDESQYLFAAGAPDQAPYENYSRLLRRCLAPA
jgi:uncharacterized protein with NRDE domain